MVEPRRENPGAIQPSDAPVPFKLPDMRKGFGALSLTTSTSHFGLWKVIGAQLERLCHETTVSVGPR